MRHDKNDKILLRSVNGKAKSWSHRLKLVFVSLAFLLFGILATVIWAFAVEPGLITVTRLTVVDSRLPDSWDGRVIAFFSDIHAGPAFNMDRIRRVVSRISEAKPDLILYGGDLIDSRTPTDPAFAGELSGALSSLEAPFGCFAVLGNHDNRLAAERKYCRSLLENGGFRLLVNESVVLDGLLLGGMDESFFGHPDLSETFPPNQDGSGDAGGASLFRILMMHQPDYAAKLPENSAQLLLSGHTHNGQVTFFGYPLRTVHQGRLYTYGHYFLSGGRQLIVSRGLGTVGYEARFFAPPEIMLITLRRTGSP
jgi:uncharacterized protein